MLKEAAYEVFSKKGYKAAAISEIAKQAKVAVGTFYNFYESKEKPTLLICKVFFV